jgi:hypothetical protein
MVAAATASAKRRLSFIHFTPCYPGPSDKPGVLTAISSSAQAWAEETN